jgi:hypothetical protein
MAERFPVEEDVEGSKPFAHPYETAWFKKSQAVLF